MKLLIPSQTSTVLYGHQAISNLHIDLTVLELWKDHFVFSKGKINFMGDTNSYDDATMIMVITIVIFSSS